MTRVGDDGDIETLVTHFGGSLGNFVGRSEPLKMARIGVDDQLPGRGRGGSLRYRLWQQPGGQCRSEAGLEEVTSVHAGQFISTMIPTLTI